MSSNMSLTSATICSSTLLKLAPTIFLSSQNLRRCAYSPTISSKLILCLISNSQAFMGSALAISILSWNLLSITCCFFSISDSRSLLMRCECSSMFCSVAGSRFLRYSICRTAMKWLLTSLSSNCLVGAANCDLAQHPIPPRFLNDVSPIIIKRSYCMYNFRKIKKKKKNKPTEATTLTPQETLFQISDCKEDAVEPSAADLFISKFHQVDTPKQGPAPKSATNFVRYNEQRPKFSMAAKRKSSVQQKPFTHQYSQSQAFGKEAVRFIYLKRHKTEWIDSESVREKSVRSKTVFSMGESCKWKNRPFSSQGRSQCLNLKDPTSLKSMRKAPPFMVKNIKLESRYRPLYLQDY